jgi:hypothetical protein
LEKSKFKIYLFAPEANAQFSRRIRGLGVAYGVAIDVVTQTSDLPENPSPNCSLLIPAKFAGSTEVTIRAWAQILLTSQEHHESKDIRGSTNNSVSHDNIATWSRVIEDAVALHSTIHHPHSWQCINTNSHGTLQEVSAHFQTWLKKHKVKSYREVKQLLIGLERLTSVCGSEAAKLDASADGNALTVSLNLHDTSKTNGTALRDLVNTPLMAYTCMRNLPGAVILQFKIDFATARDVLIRNLPHPLEEDAGETSTKEAS